MGQNVFQMSFLVSSEGKVMNFVSIPAWNTQGSSPSFSGYLARLGVTLPQGAYRLTTTLVTGIVQQLPEGLDEQVVHNLRNIVDDLFLTLYRLGEECFPDGVDCLAASLGMRQSVEDWCVAMGRPVPFFRELAFTAADPRTHSAWPQNFSYRKWSQTLKEEIQLYIVYEIVEPQGEMEKVTVRVGYISSDETPFSEALNEALVKRFKELSLIIL